MSKNGTNRLFIYNFKSAVFLPFSYLLVFMEIAVDVCPLSELSF